MGLLPRGSTPSGSVAPSWPLSPPSRRCGSPSKNSTRPDPASSTASASKNTCFFVFPFFYSLYHILCYLFFFYLFEFETNDVFFYRVYIRVSISNRDFFFVVRKIVNLFSLSKIKFL